MSVRPPRSWSGEAAGARAARWRRATSATCARGRLATQEDLPRARVRLLHKCWRADACARGHRTRAGLTSLKSSASSPRCRRLPGGCRSPPSEPYAIRPARETVPDCPRGALRAVPAADRNLAVCRDSRTVSDGTRTRDRRDHNPGAVPRECADVRNAAASNAGFDDGLPSAQTAHHATARTAMERSDWAPKRVSVPKSVRKDRNLRRSALRHRPALNSLFPGIPGRLEGFCSTTENRGVPGSSPGLATREPPAIGRFSRLGSAIRAVDASPMRREVPNRAAIQAPVQRAARRGGPHGEWSPVVEGIAAPRPAVHARAGFLARRDARWFGMVSRGCRGTQGHRRWACSGRVSRWAGSGARARVL